MSEVNEVSEKIRKIEVKVNIKGEEILESKEMEDFIRETCLESEDCHQFFKTESPTPIELCMGVHAPQPDLPKRDVIQLCITKKGVDIEGVALTPSELENLSKAGLFGKIIGEKVIELSEEGENEPIGFLKCNDCGFEKEIYDEDYELLLNRDAEVVCPECKGNHVKFVNYET